MLRLNKNKCSGCSACVAVCPKGCITMQYDCEGFLYPKITEELCINCGLCEKMCQSDNPIISDNKPKGYACYNRDEQIRADSSSGGIFTLIATEVISREGVVFGAGFDDNFNVRHICVKTVEDLSMLRGSKYVQSAIGDSYIEAEKYLKENLPVLFTGTPCQIDGLLHYLNKDYDNLYTQDIICHGVPSPMVWQEYIRFREKNAGSKVKSILLRDKRSGWKRYSVMFKFENGSSYEETFSKDPFMKGFLSNLYLRSSCYNCHSKTLNRNSDITLADFWGVEEVQPDMFDNRGTSLVFVNTKKGQDLFSSVSGRFVAKEVDIATAVKHNSSAYKSVRLTVGRNKFFSLFERVGFHTAVKICSKRHYLYTLLQRIKRSIKRLIIKKGA